MKDYQHLGKFLRQKRIQGGYTQGQLAEAIEVNLSQFVSNWERGLCAPPAYSIPALVKVLKIDRRELIEVMVKDSRISIENKVLSKNEKKRRQA